jgi:NADH-quinone oxidoreductase subunit M
LGLPKFCLTARIPRNYINYRKEILAMTSFPLLSSIILCPFLGMLFILFFSKNDHLTKSIALISSLFSLFFAGLIYLSFDKNIAGFQLQEISSLIKALNCNFHLGIDGISLFFVILTAILTPICILASWNSIKFRVKEYMIAFLLLESLVFGVFSSLDFLLFYLFFEAMLIPMFLLIGIWGGENRVYAAIKFFLFTLAGSLFLLIAVIYIYQNTNHEFNIINLYNLVPKFSSLEQNLLWFAFFASFAVKVPMWPFHTWLPDAHVQAPTAGSVILAGILLKMGAYGFLRFSLPMLPGASHHYAEFIFVLSAIAVIYASIVAFAQTDMKKLIAYSSIAHMGFVTMGIFTFNQQAIEGVLFQMVSHGIVSAALFLCVGVLYDRMHTKEISKYGGVVSKMPKFAFFFLVFTMASIGLPGTSGFVGEMLVIVGTYQVSHLYAALAATSLVLGSIYMLWLYKRVMFGKVTNDEVNNLSDITIREIILLSPLLALTILLGIYPNIITDVFHVSVVNLIGK